MHRSGTSYTASVLQKAGLNIGTNLLAANTGNDLGHFEDKDFLELHMSALKNRGLNEDGWSLQTISSFNENELQQAKSILNAKTVLEWGWKEPRTTLFLEAWQPLIPDAYYLFVYRKPWEVVDSIFRRNTDPMLINDPVLTIKNWMFYNEQILKHYHQNKERSVLVDIENIMQNPNDIIRELNAKFNFSLNHVQDSIFDSTKFVNNKDISKESFCYTYFKPCIDLYLELQKQSSIPSILPYEYKASENTMNLFRWWYLAAQSNRLNKNLILKDVEISEHIQQINELKLEIDDLKTRNHELDISNSTLENELNWITNSKWWKLRAFIRSLILKK